SPSPAGHRSIPVIDRRRGPATGPRVFPASRGGRSASRMTRPFLEVHMKRVISCGAVALLLLVGADATAQGKLSGFAAIGPTTTSGDLKDADSTKPGFMAPAGFETQSSRTA